MRVISSKGDEWLSVAKLKKMSVHNCPIAPNTLYQWSAHGRHPEIFRKVGRKLFVNLTVLFQLAEGGDLQ